MFLRKREFPEKGGKRLILITSDYNMFNVLNMIKNELLGTQNMECAVCDNCKNAKQIFESTKKIFSKSHYLQVSREKSYFSLKKVLSAILRNKKMFFSKYTDIYVGAYGSSAVMLYLYLLQRRNSGCKFHYVEEGFATYEIKSEDMFALLGNGLKKKIRDLIIGKQNPIRIPEEIFLYQPQYLDAGNFKMVKLPMISRDDKYWYNQFLYCPQAQHFQVIEKCRAIFFGDYLSRNKLINYQEEEDLLLELDSKKYAKQIVYKEHPKSKFGSCNVQVMNMQYYLDSPAIWEMLLLNIKADSKILISVYSTALYSGSFIFGDNDTIIYLHKFLLKKDSETYNTLNTFVEKMKKEGERVFAPETKEEFFDLLEALIERKEDV